MRGISTCNPASAPELATTVGTYCHRVSSNVNPTAEAAPSKMPSSGSQTPTRVFQGANKPRPIINAPNTGIALSNSSISPAPKNIRTSSSPKVIDSPGVGRLPGSTSRNTHRKTESTGLSKRTIVIVQAEIATHQGLGLPQIW